MTVREKVNRGLPWSFFYNYYEVQRGKYRYFDRVNKLDSFFDKICVILKG